LIPSSVVVLGEWSFRECKSLESVIFESGSRSERIEKWMFEGCRVGYCSVSEELTRAREVENLTNNPE
jgi:hypothetical protein